MYIAEKLYIGGYTSTESNYVYMQLTSMHDAKLPDGLPLAQDNHVQYLYLWPGSFQVFPFALKTLFA